MRFLLDRIKPICAISVLGGWYDQFDRHGRSLVDFVRALHFSCRCHRSSESGSLPGPSQVLCNAIEKVVCNAIESLQRKTAPGKTIGTAKTFNQLKRYGFIRLAVDGKDVFVHLSAVRQAGLAAVRKCQSYLLKSKTVVAR